MFTFLLFALLAPVEKDESFSQSKKEINLFDKTIDLICDSIHKFMDDNILDVIEIASNSTNKQLLKDLYSESLKKIFQDESFSIKRIQKELFNPFLIRKSQNILSEIYNKEEIFGHRLVHDRYLMCIGIKIGLQKILQEYVSFFRKDNIKLTKEFLLYELNLPIYFIKLYKRCLSILYLENPMIFIADRYIMSQNFENLSHDYISFLHKVMISLI